MTTALLSLALALAPMATAHHPDTVTALTDALTTHDLTSWHRLDGQLRYVASALLRYDHDGDTAPLLVAFAGFLEYPPAEADPTHDTWHYATVEMERILMMAIENHEASQRVWDAYKALVMTVTQAKHEDLQATELWE